jgi:methylenetetrahydrofolate dehydrogenase (NADP+)/methenyltetrahydrofolate cyclohydrolase
MAQLLDGARVRDDIKAELAPRVDALTKKLGRAPGLSVILVGSNPASQIYVAGKTRTARDIGIFSETLTPPDSVTTEELIRMVDSLNANPQIDGILVQLPLPGQVDESAVLLRVSPHKDVDGFHPCNVGMLSTGRPGPRPCTPNGIIQLLKRYHIPMQGRRATVVGRSDIVGKPMAILLLAENATVTMAHSRTQDLPAVCREDRRC